MFRTGSLVLGDLLIFHGLTTCSALSVFIVAESVSFVIVCCAGDAIASDLRSLATTEGADATAEARGIISHSTMEQGDTNRLNC